MNENGVQKEATEQQKLIGNVIALLFAILGIGIIVVFLYNVFNNTDNSFNALSF